MKFLSFRFMYKALVFPDRALSKVFIFLIKFYQKTFSPDHSFLGKMNQYTGCKFYPSCSQYAILVLQKKGFTLGIFKIFWRILRCNPFSSGGVDNP